MRNPVFNYITSQDSYFHQIEPGVIPILAKDVNFFLTIPIFSLSHELYIKAETRDFQVFCQGLSYFEVNATP